MVIEYAQVHNRESPGIKHVTVAPKTQRGTLKWLNQINVGLIIKVFGMQYFFRENIYIDLSYNAQKNTITKFCFLYPEKVTQAETVSTTDDRHKFLASF